MPQPYILFLDFDGPLFSDRVIRFHPDNRNQHHPSLDRIKESIIGAGNPFDANHVMYWKMDDVAVGMLNTLMQIQPFDTVVSSTWRAFCNKETTQLLFDLNNLELKFHDDWATSNTVHYRDAGYGSSKSDQRPLEIKDWLTRNKVGQYIILDDPCSGGSLMDDNRVVALGLDPTKVVLVDSTIGMEQHHYSTIRDLLNDEA